MDTGRRDIDDIIFYQNKTEDNMIGGDSSHIDNEKENKRSIKRRLFFPTLL